MSSSGVIYGLADPRTYDGSIRALRYIGKSVTTSRHRLHNHLSECRGDWEQTHKARWLRKLMRDDVTPVVTDLVQAPVSDLGELERDWIKRARDAGADLTNATDGGDGTPGRRCSAATRAKISAKRTGQLPSAETRVKISKSLKKRVFTAEHLEKISRSLRGRRRSADHCARLSAAQRGRKASPEARANMSVVRVGRKHSESTRLKIRDGIRASSWAKLSMEKAREIRSLYAGGVSMRSLAKTFGVTRPTIAAVVNNRTWVD